MANTHEVLEGVKEYTRKLLGDTFVKAAEASASRSESAATRSESAAREAVAAEVHAGVATEQASAAAGHAEQAGEDRVQTGADRLQTGEDRVQTGEDREAAEGWAGQSKDAATLAITAAATVSQYVGDGFPEGKVSAPVGSIYVDRQATAGAVRWIKISGSGNTGWRIEWGDTGVRDITSQIYTDQGWDLDSYATTVKVSRQGGTCFVSVASIVSANSPSGYATILQLPAGFRPRANVYGNTWRGNRVYVRTNGLLQIWGPSTILDYWQAAFDCPPEWPVTRPGVPD